MAENKLPSGVGKKIVQALKKQAEIEVNSLPEPPKNVVSEPKEQNIQQEYFDEVSQNIPADANFDDFAVQDTF